MGVKGKHMPVLTPAYGRKYKTKQDCLDDYLMGKEFIFNLTNSRLDGAICTISSLNYTAVVLRYGSNSFIYEGN